MRKLGLALLLAILGVAPAQAQNAGWPPPPGAQAMLCVYNLVQPTVAAGQAAFVNCDAHGNLIVSGGGGGGGAVTIANGADVVLGSLTDAASCASGTTATACLRQIDADIKGSVPTNPKTTTQAKLTVAVTNTYQQALASSASRVGCTIQYIAVAGTKGFVFFGSAPADTTTSFQLTNGQTVNCNIGGVAVAQDAIQVTGTGTDIFIVANQ